MDDMITVNLVHPTDSTQILTARVSRTTTPRFFVDRMVDEGILPPPATAGQYTVSRFQDGVHLLPDVPLGECGLPDGATLRVNHATTGAEA